MVHIKQSLLHILVITSITGLTEDQVKRKKKEKRKKDICYINKNHCFQGPV